MYHCTHCVFSDSVTVVDKGTGCNGCITVPIVCSVTLTKVDKGTGCNGCITVPIVCSVTV